MRNYSIDFLRGIASLSIILIHTAFWSGQAYLPAWFYNLTLLIDVPVFMFIAGFSFHYVHSISKNIKGILIQWKKWIFFIILYSLILIVFFRKDFAVTEFFSWLVYVFPKGNALAVVGGSIWFMPMYIKVTILCTLIIMIIKKYSKEHEIKHLIYLAFFFLFCFLYTALKKETFIFSIYTSFYAFIYILGYLSHRFKMKDIKQLLLLEGITLVGLIFVFYYFHLGISNIQDIKFPPSMPYLFFAAISILLFWYLKDHLKIKKDNPMNWIGKNALMFYFAQGISSSLIYFIYPYLLWLPSPIIFLLMLASNITLAILIVIGLNKLYELVESKIPYKKLKGLFGFEKIQIKKENSTL